MHLRLIACALVVISAAQAALAQEIQMSARQAEELACISNRLVEARMDVLITDVYVRGEMEGEDFEDVSDAMDEAMIHCQDQHGWTDAQTNIAAEVGMFQMIMDVNSYKLGNSAGITDAAFHQLGAVLSATPESDQAILMGGGWRDDEAVLKRLSERLLAAGLPKNPTILGYAILVMEAKLMVTFGAMDWVKIRP
jgi:hypothetical protein